MLLSVQAWADEPPLYGAAVDAALRTLAEGAPGWVALKDYAACSRSRGPFFAQRQAAVIRFREQDNVEQQAEVARELAGAYASCAIRVESAGKDRWVEKAASSVLLAVALRGNDRAHPLDGVAAYALLSYMERPSVALQVFEANKVARGYYAP